MPSPDFRFSACPKDLSKCHESFNIGREDARPLEAWSLWWTALCAAAALNVALWGYSARQLGRRTDLPDEIRATRRRLLWLAAIYVLGCGFRSVLPMVDVPRLCLHDPWIARIVVGRSVATVAELAFAAQWALLLREAGAVRASRSVLPLIAGAEVLSWFAVLTQNDLFHALENSVWPLTVVIAVFFLFTRWPYESERGRMTIIGAVGCAAAYVAFMAAYVVPMYLARWQPDQAYLLVADGIGQVLQRCTVEHDWALWWQDAAWLTPYFTVAVWISIALAHVPNLQPRK
jgi:hypothetical protein